MSVRSAGGSSLAAASDIDPEDDNGRQLDLRRQLKECDAKLARYRAALEHDGDLTVVATWIADVERQRKSLERELGRKPTTRKLAKSEIKALVHELKDIVAVLADADPEDKRAIYDELGVNLTYHADGRVRVGAGGRVLGVRVGGGTCGLRQLPRSRESLHYRRSESGAYRQRTLRCSHAALEVCPS
jgi:hypothetical protein